MFLHCCYGAVAFSVSMAVLSQGSELLFSLRYQQLEEASASLRERIRHLDDMVHCQQKKVKQMVEEVSSHRSLGPRTTSCGGEKIPLQLTRDCLKGQLPLCAVWTNDCSFLRRLFSRLKCWPSAVHSAYTLQGWWHHRRGLSLGDKSDRADLSSGFCASSEPTLISCTTAVPSLLLDVLLWFCPFRSVLRMLCSLCPHSCFSSILSLLCHTKS